MRLDIDHRADQLETMVLKCRSENHHWRRTSETVTETTRKGVISEISVTRMCPNCLVERTDIYSLPRFGLLKRRYKYTTDFMIRSRKGDSRITKQDFRAAYLARELKELLK